MTLSDEEKLYVRSLVLQGFLSLRLVSLGFALDDHDSQPSTSDDKQTRRAVRVEGDYEDLTQVVTLSFIGRKLRDKCLEIPEK